MNPGTCPECGAPMRADGCSDPKCYSHVRRQADDITAGVLPAERKTKRRRSPRDRARRRAFKGIVGC